MDQDLNFLNHRLHSSRQDSLAEHLKMFWSQERIDYFFNKSPLRHDAVLTWITHFLHVDSFGKTFEDKAFEIFRGVDNFGDIPETHCATATLKHHHDEKRTNIGSNVLASTACRYVPISCFRPPGVFREGTTVLLGARRFRSSGTTGGQDLRSISSFSSLGYWLYELVSVKTFFDVMAKVSPCRKITVFSLVPTTKDWPDSSLAQMIEWIGSQCEVHYVEDHSLQEAFETIQSTKAQSEESSFVLFGTAFHFMNLMDSGHAFTLPQNAFIIETGGTKGRSREVSRNEYFDLLVNRFGVKPHQIISEYGMCELASQAYDFVEDQTKNTLQERVYRFPFWARPMVLREIDVLSATGEGALIIDDQARIDVGFPIQTEDFVEVSLGKVTLKGRIPLSPLKGCSLNVKEILETSHPYQQKIREGVLRTYGDKTAQVFSLLHETLRSDDFLTALRRELGSKTLAERARQDLRESLPKDSESFHRLCLSTHHKMIQKYRAQIIEEPWFVIAPSSHSIASIPIACVLVALNFKVTLRVPEMMRLTNSNDKSAQNTAALEVFAKGLSGLGLNLVNGDFRIHHDFKSHVIAFGSDATIETLKPMLAPGFEILSFGSVTTASLSDFREWNDEGFTRELCYSNLALSQLGCQSVRVNFVIGRLSKDELDRFIGAAKDLLKDHDEMPATFRAAYAIEVSRLKRLGFFVDFSDSCNFIVARLPFSRFKSSDLSRLPRVLLVIEETPEKLTWQEPQFSGLNRCVVSKTYPQLGSKVGELSLISLHDNQKSSFDFVEI